LFASKEVAEERQMAAAEHWRKAKGQLKAYGAGCLFLAILAALALAYLAGYVNAAVRPDCVQQAKPSRVSTP
jgi:hypothetical protein